MITDEQLTEIENRPMLSYVDDTYETAWQMREDLKILARGSPGATGHIADATWTGRPSWAFHRR